jgi:hypothetical protein
MNGYGNSVFLRTAFEVSSGVAPVNTVAPAITGTAQEGQTVTCSTGTWTGTPTITYAYQWKRNGSNIGSATNSTYVLVTADVSQSITCQVTATNGSGSASATSNTITPTAAVDPDAQEFITAAAITDPTQQAAINTLVVDLKAYSIWSKLNAIYPMIGGTASTHKFNLKDPRDLDAAYRLVFNGGWTHSVNGATPNGTNAFADTKLNPFTVLSNNINIGYYSRTNVNALSTACEIGSTSGPSGPDYLMLLPRLNNVTWYSVLENSTYTQVADTNSAAFYTAKREGTTVKGFKNGSNVITRTGVTIQTRPNGSVYLGACNWHGLATAGWYSSRQCAFSFIGENLSDTEAANLYTAVQTFQTTLSRQI